MRLLLLALCAGLAAAHPTIDAYQTSDQDVSSQDINVATMHDLLGEGFNGLSDDSASTFFSSSSSSSLSASQSSRTSYFVSNGGDEIIEITVEQAGDYGLECVPAADLTQSAKVIVEESIDEEAEAAVGEGATATAGEGAAASVGQGASAAAGGEGSAASAAAGEGASASAAASEGAAASAAAEEGAAASAATSEGAAASAAASEGAAASAAASEGAAASAAASEGAAASAAASEGVASSASASEGAAASTAASEGSAASAAASEGAAASAAAGEGAAATSAASEGAAASAAASEGASASAAASEGSAASAAASEGAAASAAATEGAAATSAASHGAAASSSASEGAAASAAASEGAAASAAASEGSAASAAASEGSAASAAASEGSAASAAASEDSTASAAASEGSAASAAAGESAAASAAASEGSAASAAASEGSAASAAAGESASASAAASKGSAASAAAGESASASSTAGETASASAAAGESASAAAAGDSASTSTSTEDVEDHYESEEDEDDDDDQLAEKLEECVCVPYYQCKDGDVITDGEGLIDIRFNSGAHEGEEYKSSSQCANFLDVCCAAPLDGPDPDYLEELLEDYEPQCGRRNPQGVHVELDGFNEGESQFGEFPWMAIIVEDEELYERIIQRYVCGGSLIHPQIILTGAHCVNGKDPSKLQVRLGDWDTKHEKELYAHEEHRVASMVLHERFNKRTLFNDVALLFLEEPVELKKHIDTICLPEPNEEVEEKHCVSTGFGKDKFHGGSFQNIMKQVDLALVSRRECQKRLRTTKLGRFFRLDRSFTCAGGEEGVDTCKGDGGSPLVCPTRADPERYVQVGIVAWGIGCGEGGIPGVYGSVPKLLPWINAKIADKFGSPSTPGLPTDLYGSPPI